MPRGFTSAQVALGRLLAYKPWIVPISGTTKLAHLQENLMTADLTLTQEELRELDGIISKLTVFGDRCTAVGLSRVGQ